jgi:Fe-S oxidoreductase
MLVLLVATLSAFAWSANRRWQLLQFGRGENRFDRLADRARSVWRYAFAQEKMDYYQPAGFAHKLIFAGFIVLLLRTIVLAGRGFVPSFNLFVLAPYTVPGEIYEFAKDTVATLVLVGVSVFVYYRVIRPNKRTTLSFEALVILGIIATMMIADMMYDGAAHALGADNALLCTGKTFDSHCIAMATILAPLGPSANEAAQWSFFPSPAGSFFASLFSRLQPGTLIVIAHAGFWTHISLVLIFLNLLPHSKHFHVITAIPNVFFRDLKPAGRLPPMAPINPAPGAPAAEGAEAPAASPTYSEALMELVGKASEAADPGALAVGVGRIDHFTWKAILDFYTCTECGRCSENCPAHRTGKILSPKHLTLALRDHLYSREDEVLALKNGSAKKLAGEATPGASADTAENKPVDIIDISTIKPVNLISDVIHPDVLWACTTCRACEEQCPVMISYVDKIVDMRRNLVLVRGEFPSELQKPFNGMETNGNPWNLSRMDRAEWSSGLGIPTVAEKPNAEVLYWVGCAASYDDRAKKIARATAKLLKAAGVDFAILGQEENCTGDPARRAGNEFLFAMLAEGNAATLKAVQENGGARKVITTCPHCFNTLKNEYPDFGAKLDVIHHTDFLLGLLAEKKLDPKNPVVGRVTYHDSCYLGRYNGVYDAPREILKAIPGVELVEPEYWNRQRGLCCGAGGAQMWMEEQNQNRVSGKRTLQLIDALQAGAPAQNGEKHDHPAGTIASACPFCMTMLSDGLKSQNAEEKIAQLDVAELLERSCAVDEVLAARELKASEAIDPIPPPPAKVQEGEPSATV